MNQDFNPTMTFSLAWSACSLFVWPTATLDHFTGLHTQALIDIWWMLWSHLGLGIEYRHSDEPGEPNSNLLILSFHIGRTYHSSVVKLRQEQWFRTSTKSEKKKKEDEQEKITGSVNRRGRGGRRGNKNKNASSVSCTYKTLPLFMSVLALLSSPLFFTHTPTCRGPVAGMVDLSDVRSMSRPCSPLSVFPSPCMMRPVASDPAAERTLSVVFTEVKMLMRGWQWSLWKEVTLDARHQAPGEAKDNGGPNKWLIHSILVSSSLWLSLFKRSLCFFLPLPNVYSKNSVIPNEHHINKPGKYCVKFILRDHI